MLYVNRELIVPENASAEAAVPKKEKQASLLVKVITQPIIKTNSGKVFETIGTGKAKLSINIYPLVTGEITKVNFKAQDTVEKNHMLVELDKREQRLAVRLAEVEIKAAKNLLTRYEQAVKDGAVPESEVDSARADVEAAQVALEQAQVALDNRTIKAPFAGVVGIPTVELGERVDNSTVITSLDDRSTLFVDFEVPETLAGFIQTEQGQSQNLVASTPAFPDREFPAKISALESRLDETRRTLRVRSAINNEEDILRPGMSFRLVWQVPGKDYPTIPEIALQWSDKGAFIWVVRDNIAKKININVIARTAGQVLIEGNVNYDEHVVAEGLQRLRPDMQVEILNQEIDRG